MQIHQAITGFLSHRKLVEVHSPGAANPPHPLSHAVPFPRLEIPISGRYENEIEIGGVVRHHILKPGEALLIAPNCWNRPTWRHPMKLLSLLFGARQMGVSLVSTPGGGLDHVVVTKIPIPQPHCGPTRAILDALLDVARHGGPASAYPDLVTAILRCVREALDHPLSQGGRKADRLLQKICIHLQEHYQHGTSRDQVAKLFGIAPNHLSRLFRTHGGMSFNQYLNSVRTDRAKLLLKTYPMKLDEIARQCGYRDTPYFCRAFRRMTRLTPGEYRQAHTGKEQ